MVRTPAFLVGSGKVTASCKLEQIITGASAKAIERVTLYVSKTQFVDSRTSLASVDLKGADIKDLNAVSLTSDFPAIAGQSYAYDQDRRKNQWGRGFAVFARTKGSTLTPGR
ncbi:DUF3823 domain-containing protein [Spirosoma sp. RP8]|uniref:DUF3823 domain-containing protein n=1 Tax=Spirosoma liriopis TaxID=2937440 RepID=A0ABT0HS61_9BACT|nr:DUF3823 domain-containing protein [Spirosoma liriopis]MCK8495013.1 DUF3823 domain-containing protein [Spirosoma liriopis]